MKYRRLAKNTKALSPVIATIILVAVTVAIAIAVAAWLGALTFNFTQIEQLNVTQATFYGNSTVMFALSNVGTQDVTISSVSSTGGSGTGAVTGATFAFGSTAANTCLNNGIQKVAKGASCNLVAIATKTGFTAFASGTQYSFTLLSTQGHQFPYSAIPP